MRSPNAIHTILSRRVGRVLGVGLALHLLGLGLPAEESAVETRPLLEACEVLRTQIAEEAALRQAPADAAAADEVAFVLEREQIRSDAEIEVLKLEVARFTGEKQGAALASLIRLIEARERRWCHAIGRLEGLAAVPGSVEFKQQGEKGEKEGRLSVTFEPADLTKDPES